MEQISETKSINNRSYLGIRHLQCLLLFLAQAVGYAMRVNLSVAIVVMTDKNATNTNFEIFDWSHQINSYVSSSFFWGYVITQIPAGKLTDKYGPKYILLIGILISSILALFSPLITHFGDWPYLCLTRAIQGLTQGMLFPSTHAILSKWALIEERGALCGFCYAGSIFGSFFMLVISGWIAASSLGWPGIFYVSGIMGLLWVAAWFIWGANKPENSKHITAYEKSLIATSLQKANTKKNHKLKTPWLKIFTSPAVLVLLISHCAHNWGFWTLLAELPSYMKGTYDMDIKQNALLTSLPYLMMVLLSFVFAFISKRLSNYISTSKNRKLLNTIGQWIPALTLVFLSYTYNLYLAVCLLVLAVGINSASFSGFQVNHIDLSPNFAGVLVGITTCAANIMSILAPLLVGFIVTNKEDSSQWRLVFFIAAGFYFIANLLFIIFAKAKLQPWNDQLNYDEKQQAEKNKLTSSI